MKISKHEQKRTVTETAYQAHFSEAELALLRKLVSRGASWCGENDLREFGKELDARIGELQKMLVGCGNVIATDIYAADTCGPVAEVRRLKPAHTYHLVLDELGARALYAICRHIGGNQAGTRGRFDRLMKDLRAAGIDTSDDYRRRPRFEDNNIYFDDKD